MKLISSKLTCKMMVCTLCSIMMAFLFMGCERDVYNPNNGKDDEKTPNSLIFHNIFHPSQCKVRCPRRL